MGADAIHKEAGVLADVLQKSREEISLSVWRFTHLPLQMGGLHQSSNPASPREAWKALLPPPGRRTLLFHQSLGDKQILWKDFGELPPSSWPMQSSLTSKGSVSINLQHRQPCGAQPALKGPQSRSGARVQGRNIPKLPMMSAKSRGGLEKGLYQAPCRHILQLSHLTLTPYEDCGSVILLYREGMKVQRGKVTCQGHTASKCQAVLS